MLSVDDGGRTLPSFFTAIDRVTRAVETTGELLFRFGGRPSSAVALDVKTSSSRTGAMTTDSEIGVFDTTDGSMSSSWTCRCLSMSSSSFASASLLKVLENQVYRFENIYLTVIAIAPQSYPSCFQRAHRHLPDQKHHPRPPDRSSRRRWVCRSHGLQPLDLHASQAN